MERRVELPRLWVRAAVDDADVIAPAFVPGSGDGPSGLGVEGADHADALDRLDELIQVPVARVG